jgi:hypothetical protein
LFDAAVYDHASEQVPIYCAPALPLGHDFHGIVYLHGSIEHEARRLVLTDEDFGRAYLTEGWARRFLLDLFSSHTVLFVGYSHNDLIVSYLARSLPPGDKRYALTNEGKTESWKHLGIKPIEYPHSDDGNLHKALVESLAEWAKFNQRDFLEHETQMELICSKAPSRNPVHDDYIKWTLSKPETASLFTRYAEDPEWLFWVEENGYLDPLFKTQSLDEVSLKLAEWIVTKHAVNNPYHCFEVIQRKGRVLSSQFAALIIRQISKCDELDPRVLGYWVNILISNPTTPLEWHGLGSLLSKIKLPDEFDTLFLLLERLTRQCFHLKQSFWFSDGPRPDNARVHSSVSPDGDLFFLEELWKQIISGHLDIVAEPLLPILEHQLLMAYTISRSLNADNPGVDLISFKRKAIEPHEQNTPDDINDFIISATRDLLEWLIKNKPKQARTVIFKWIDSDAPILVRLALHGLRMNRRALPKTKVKLILERNWLFAPQYHHEVYELLRETYSALASELKQVVVEQAQNEYDAALANDETGRMYHVFGLLSWLHKIDPGDSGVNSALDVIQSKHPQWRPGKYPSLRSFTESGTAQYRSPYSTEQLYDMDLNQATILEELLTYQGEQWGGLDRVNRDGLLHQISVAVGNKPEWGINLAKALADYDSWESDLWDRVLWGWEQTQMENKSRFAVIQIIKKLEPLFVEKAVTIVSILEKAVSGDPKKLDVELVNTVEDVSFDLWRVWALHIP